MEFAPQHRERENEQYQANQRRQRAAEPLPQCVKPEIESFTPSVCQGRNPVVFRFGTNPTGMRVTSFSDLMSITETSFVTGFAT